MLGRFRVGSGFWVLPVGVGLRLRFVVRKRRTKQVLPNSHLVVFWWIIAPKDSAGLWRNYCHPTHSVITPWCNALIKRLKSRTTLSWEAFMWLLEDKEPVLLKRGAYSCHPVSHELRLYWEKWDVSAELEIWISRYQLGKFPISAGKMWEQVSAGGHSMAESLRWQLLWVWIMCPSAMPIIIPANKSISFTSDEKAQPKVQYNRPTHTAPEILHLQASWWGHVTCLPRGVLQRWNDICWSVHLVKYGGIWI